MIYKSMQRQIPVCKNNVPNLQENMDILNENVQARIECGTWLAQVALPVQLTAWHCISTDGDECWQPIANWPNTIRPEIVGIQYCRVQNVIH